MAKIVLDTITGGYDLSIINNNFDKIEAEFQNKVLYRDNPVGEANTLQSDIDANGKRIYNLPEPLLDSQAARLQDVQKAIAGGAANLIEFTPYGNIVATNVQAALQEEIDDLASANGTSLVGTKRSELGAVTRTQQSKNSEWLTAADFGVVGDGVTNDSVAFQAAIDAAKARGKRLRVGSGKYLVSNLVVEDVIIEGEGVGEQDNPVNEGTVFYITDLNNPAFIVKRGAGFIGVNFYYPSQVTSGTPTVYPPTISGYTLETVTNVRIDNCVFINSYVAVRFGDVAKTAAHGRLSMHGCTVYGIAKCFELHYLLDVLQISDCIFSWGHFDMIAPGQTLKNWSAKNAVAFDLDRVDGLQIDNSIVYGSHVGIDVNTALSDLLKVNNTLFDAVPYALNIQTTGDLANAAYSGCSFHGYAFGDNTYVSNVFTCSATGSLGTEISFSGCQFALARGGFFNFGGSTLKSLQITGSQFGPIGTASGTVAAHSHIFINDADARLTVTGCDFDGNAYSAGVALNLNSIGQFTFTGNSMVNVQTPISIGTVATGGVIANNQSSGTGASGTVAISAGAQQKVLFGVNLFDKPNATLVGAPKFVAFLSGSTTVNSGTDTTIAFATEAIDTTGSYNTTTSTFTAPITGVYRFSFRVTHDATIATTDRWLVKLKTTTRDYSQLYRAPAADILTVVGSCLAHMTAGDTAQVTIARSGGAGSFVTQLDGGLTEFSGELIL